MGVIDLMVLFIFTFYTKHIISMMLSKKDRRIMQKTNKELDKLRKKKYKTIEEQKEFLNTKYPKKEKFKWEWKIIPSLALMIFMFIVIFRAWMFLWDYVGIELKIWQGILIIIIFPFLLNYVLEKFNIQKGDLRYLLRW